MKPKSNVDVSEIMAKYKTNAAKTTKLPITRVMADRNEDSNVTVTDPAIFSSNQQGQNQVPKYLKYEKHPLHEYSNSNSNSQSSLIDNEKMRTRSEIRLNEYSGERPSIHANMTLRQRRSMG